ncbi:hypothetical protein NL676_030036 [Syzygium grande]|nr:hypothetical protein NL676_030036 [Syzygium grande]
MHAFSDFLDENSLKFVKRTMSGRIVKKPHDRKVSDLSQVLWGGGGGVATSPKKDKHAAAPLNLPEEKSEDRDWASVPSLLQLNEMELDGEVQLGQTKLPSPRGVVVLYPTGEVELPHILIEEITNMRKLVKESSVFSSLELLLLRRITISSF